MLDHHPQPPPIDFDGPIALDLYCGGGGASAGLAAAGFHVIGVDLADMRHYPYQRIQGDAIANARALTEHLNVRLIWASPPCQAYTGYAKQKGTRDDHPDLVGPTRDALDELGIPYVMENIPAAPLRADMMLCGSMFGLRLVRHRHFEFGNGFKPMHEAPEHRDHHPRYVMVTGHPGGSSKRDGGDHFGKTADWREAMAIGWLPASVLKEAIPPHYSAWITGGLSAIAALA